MPDRLKKVKAKDKTLNFFLTGYVIVSGIVAIFFLSVVGMFAYETFKLIDSIGLYNKPDQISPATLSKLNEVEKQIIPLIKKNKVNSYKYVWLESCESIQIDEIFYTSESEGCPVSDENIYKNDLAKSNFNTIKSFDILEIRSYHNRIKNQEGKYVDGELSVVDFTFSYGFKQDTLVYALAPDYVEKQNRQADKEEYKLKQVQGNWYKQ